MHREMGILPGSAETRDKLSQLVGLSPQLAHCSSTRALISILGGHRYAFTASSKPMTMRGYVSLSSCATRWSGPSDTGGPFKRMPLALPIAICSNAARVMSSPRE
mmetsp:Transcript_6259/g.18757  ORF Transcript_6259/g.18757 Transcript_6259/m.18757 type:complete len:105 (+) Transcript_6259:1171-1485(+)